VFYARTDENFRPLSGAAAMMRELHRPANERWQFIGHTSRKVAGRQAGTQLREG
jgi:hypothetical protein